jgi:glycosyltransferase involved in cell wall biosynthesis
VREPAALAEKIALVLASPLERQLLSRNAAATAQGYDWRVIAERLLSIFESASAALPAPQPATASAQ